MMLNDNRFYDSNESENEEENENEEDKLVEEDSDENSPVEFQHDAVSALNHCQSNEARRLCLLNLDYKLEHSDQYDIGGTYTKDNPDLWFFCTTSMGPANRLLNLFVCQRSKGIFQLSISEVPSQIKKNELDKYPNYLSKYKLKMRTFRSTHNDKCHYITSYCFNPDDMTFFNKTFCIPIEVELTPTCLIDTEILKKVKASHSLSGIFKRGENTDFIIESNSGKKFNVHKVVLVAHSKVIKRIVENSKSNTAIFDINDDEMEVLLEFLYTGKSKSILDENCYKLMDIAYKFELHNLLTLLKLAIIKKIDVKNAVEIAVLTEKFKLECIQKEVFEFIKKNPEVLETEGWKNLNDVALTKKLFQKIYCG